MSDVRARVTTALADRYRIERELGEGGMATVYLAHDLRHERKIAVKVLRPELAAVIGAERFLHEIKTTANLQHPHILGLLDSGRVDGLVWYAMPFVQGESLRDRLQREKQLPIPEAVRIAKEVASALDYAHRHGVIHRDIKPENILLHDGSALVADFGIALAASSGSRMTETGMSLGTPHYMSPEQAMGEREITARSDVYALGCVFYEMLIGEPPFTGPTAQAIVAKVLTEKPASLHAKRARVSPQLEDAVLTALEKLPADRYATAAEFAEALNDTKTTGVVRGSTAQPSNRTRLLPLALVGGIALGVVATVLLTTFRRDKVVVTGPIVHVTIDDGLEIQPAISPDGKVIAYAAGTSLHVRIFLRPVSGGRAVPLTSDSVSTQQEPQWSPSGGSVLYLANGGVDTVAAGLGGGTPVTLIGATNTPVQAATWSPDGRQIAFVRKDSLMIYTIASGASRFLVKEAAKMCAWSPRGDLLACTTPRDFAAIGFNMGNTGPSTIKVIPVGGGTAVALSGSASLNISPVWSSDGRRLYFVSNRDGQRDIYYQRISSDGHAQGDLHRLTTALNVVSLSLSRDGHKLAYSVYTPQANVWSLPILPNGVATSAVARQETFGHQLIESIAVTRDGKTLVYDADRDGNSDIWRLTLGEREAEALTNSPVDEFGGELSPDGSKLAYYSYPEGSNRGVIWVKPMNGGPAQRVNTDATVGIFPRWLPDGKSLDWGCGTQRICTATQDGAGKWSVTTSVEGRTNFSPDGRWSTNARQTDKGAVVTRDSISIMAQGSAQEKVLYVRRAPTDPSVTNIQWGPDNRTLYFRHAETDGRVSFWKLSIDGGAPRLVAHLDDLTRPSYRRDFATDGRRIYFGVYDRQSDISVVELIER